MTFVETIAKLRELTKQTQIYALISHEDGKFGIGFRRQCVESPYFDPVVDGNAFMLCADAYNNYSNTKIDTTGELWYTPIDAITVHLRAQAIAAGAICQIDLGKYEVNHIQLCELYPGTDIPSRIHLEISRF
jgi:hypothetical protein